MKASFREVDVAASTEPSRERYILIAARCPALVDPSSPVRDLERSRCRETGPGKSWRAAKGFCPRDFRERRAPPVQRTAEPVLAVTGPLGAASPWRVQRKYFASCLGPRGSCLSGVARPMLWVHRGGGDCRFSPNAVVSPWSKKGGSGTRVRARTASHALFTC